MTFRNWAGHLHWGQLILLSVLVVAVGGGLLLWLVFAVTQYSSDRDRLVRVGDYSAYYSSGEDRLSNAELWEKKVDGYWQKDEATAYVVHRPGVVGDTGTSGRVSDPTPTFRASLRVSTLQSLAAGLLLLSTICIEWIILWYWFGARRSDARSATQTTPP